MRLLAALASAGLLLLATPPQRAWPVALVALVPVLLAVRGTTPGRALALGWAMGTAYNAVACFWWFPSLHRPTTLPVTLCLLLTLLIAAWQGLVFALGAGGCRLLARRWRLNPVFSAPLLFALADAAVPALFKGYIGTTVWPAWPLLQVAEVGGPPAVSALVVLANAVAAEGALALWRRRLPERAALVGALVLLAAVGGGWLRAAGVAAARQRAPGASVGLVQLNKSVLVAADPQGWQKAALQALGRSTTLLLAQGAELVVWPEGAWQADLPRQPLGAPGPEFLRDLAAGFQGRILFGAITQDQAGTRYNSAVLLSDAGRVEAYYDKNRPVPLFEYMPLADRLPGLADAVRSLIRRDGRFLHPGTTPAVLAAGGLRPGVLICSEEMQAGYGTVVARQRPNLLVGMADDYWQHNTWAVSQHMALALFRAVEARRDLVHVADSGVSAVVDAAGRVRWMAPAYGGPEPAVALRTEVAPLELFAPGPYLIRWFPAACLLALVLAALGSRRRCTGPDVTPEAAGI